MSRKYCDCNKVTLSIKQDCRGHTDAPLTEKQVSNIKKVLVKSILKIVAALNLEFCRSGYADCSEPDGKLKLAKLPRPIKLRLPIPSNSEDLDGVMEFQYLTRRGYISDTYAGGALSEDWCDIPIENLVRFAKALSSSL